MKEKMVVRKHIDLVTAKNSLSGFEGKLIAMLIKELDMDLEGEMRDFEKMVFGIDRIVKLLNIKSIHTSQLRKTIKLLASKSCEIQSINPKTKKKTYTVIPFFSSLSYAEHGYYITYRFNKAMIPYILQLHKNFVKYNIINILQFESKYSLGIYELCKNDINFKKEKKHSREYTLEELQEWLQTPKSYSIKYSDFKKKVLEPVTKDITTYSDVALTYIEIKQGRKVVKIKFEFKKNYQNFEHKKEYAEILKKHRRKLSPQKYTKYKKRVLEMQDIENGKTINLSQGFTKIK